MGRTHRHNGRHGLGAVTSGTTAAVVSGEEVSDVEAQKALSSGQSEGHGASHCTDRTRQTRLLERLWRPVDHVLTDICYTIDDRFIIPQNITAVPGLMEKGLSQRQGLFVLVGHFMSIIAVMVFAEYFRRFSNLMSGTSPVIGEILFCVSHLSQVTQEQLGWSLFCTGFLPPHTFEGIASQRGLTGSGGITSGGNSQGARQQMLESNGAEGCDGNGALGSASQSSAGMGTGGGGGMMGCPQTGGNLVRYFLGRKANNMIRQELLRSYLYSSFYSPSAFLLEQTVWFVVLAVTLDVVFIQRLALAAFFANVVGWLPLYSVKSLAGVGVTLVVVLMYWIPPSEADDTVLSLTFLQRPMHRVLSAYCASLCITLLFAETLLLDEVRQMLVQEVFTLPRRFLRVGGGHPVLVKLVDACVWVRCECFYFVDFYFFLGIMCWLSLVLMETAAGISVFGTATLLAGVPWLVGSGWRRTPMQALKDTAIYVCFYVVMALLLAHIVPWSGLAFLSNAVQSSLVLIVMAARCKHKQPGGSAYVLLWVAMMCAYLYVKDGAMRRGTGSLVWDLHDSNPPANVSQRVDVIWSGTWTTEEGALSLLHIVCIIFLKLLWKGLSEEGMQILHFNVVVFGSMVLFSTSVRAMLVEGVRFANPGQSESTSAEVTSIPAAASAASTLPQCLTTTTVTLTNGEQSGPSAQVLSGRPCCLRGVRNGLQSSPVRSSSPVAKNRATPHGSAAKAASASTAGGIRKSWVPLTQDGVAMIDDCGSGNGNGSVVVASLVKARAEETVVEAFEDMEKVIEDVKEDAREVVCIAEGGDEQSACSKPPVATPELSINGEGAAAVLKETEAPATPKTSVYNASLSKGEINEEEQPSVCSAASLAHIPTWVNSVDEAVKKEGKKIFPHPISDADGRKANASSLVSQRKEGGILQEESRSTSLAETVNCNAILMTSTMGGSDMSSPMISSLGHDQAASLTSRSSTAAEAPLETCHTRQERERDKDRRRERERVQTRASTAAGASTTPFPVAKEEQEDEQKLPQLQQASRPSAVQMKSTATCSTSTSASCGPAPPLPRSRTEIPKKPVEASTFSSVTNRQTSATEKKELAHVENSVEDAQSSTTSVAKAVSSTELVASAGAVSVAPGMEVRAEKEKGKVAKDKGDGKKADGKTKVVAGKSSASSKGTTQPCSSDAKAVESAAASGSALSQLPKLRHEHVSATTISKPPSVADKPTAGASASGEKEGNSKITQLTTLQKGGAATAKKGAAATAALSDQISASAPGSRTSSSKSVATPVTVLPVPLPRSAQTANNDSAAGASEALSANVEKPHEVPLQQAWRTGRSARAVSQVTAAPTTDGSGPLTVEELKQEVKSKPATKAVADDAEDSDVGYDLDRVLSFLRLKTNYSAGVDDGDDDDQSSSVVWSADCREGPSSFLHSYVQKHSTTTPQPSFSNALGVDCSECTTPNLGVDADVSLSETQRNYGDDALQETFTRAKPSGNESLTNNPQRVTDTMQSRSEWAVKTSGGFGECSTESLASANYHSGNCATHGRRSPLFHVFSTDPNAAQGARATSSSLPPTPSPAHTGVTSYSNELRPSEMTENNMELSAAAGHIYFNTGRPSLGHYPVSQIAEPPSPPLEAQQSSSSHIPFSVSTVNLSGSQMSSISSIERANSDTAADWSLGVPHVRVGVNNRRAMSEQVAMQKTQRSVSVGEAMRPIPFATPTMQQTMMMMMRTPQGQMAMYPMMYNQLVYMAGSNRVMHSAHRVQMTSQRIPQQQQQIVYAASTPSRGQAVDVAYQMRPDGSYLMTPIPQMSHQMMSTYQQQHNPCQRF
ncbi:hypothetical protein, conserved [Leishmania tarentolae]|uniref:Transmembrane protein n=1 Tax=Leishmania tarentolae TaxID=5689 RepID=A0A640L1A4_LEITA|nr:hypothetical protein, conserved [Leishmania tarentolae]